MKRKGSDTTVAKKVRVVTSDNVVSTIKPHLSSGIVSRLPQKSNTIVLLDDSSSDDELIIPKQISKLKKNDSLNSSSVFVVKPSLLNSSSSSVVKPSLSGRCYPSNPNAVVLEPKNSSKQSDGSSSINNSNLYEIFQSKKQCVNNTNGIIMEFDCDEYQDKLNKLKHDAATINEAISKYNSRLDAIKKGIRRLNKQRYTRNPVVLTGKEGDSVEYAVSVVFPNNKPLPLDNKDHAVAVETPNLPLWSLAQQRNDFDIIAARGLIDESKHRSIESVATVIGTHAGQDAESVATVIGTHAGQDVESVATVIGTHAGQDVESVATVIGTHAGQDVESVATVIGTHAGQDVESVATVIGTHAGQDVESVATVIGTHAGQDVYNDGEFIYDDVPDCVGL